MSTCSSRRADSRSRGSVPRTSTSATTGPPADRPRQLRTDSVERGARARHERQRGRHWLKRCGRRRAILDGCRSKDQAAVVTSSQWSASGAELTRDRHGCRARRSTRASGKGARRSSTAVCGNRGWRIGRRPRAAGRVQRRPGTASWLPADRVLGAAKRSNVVAYAVAVRSPVKPEFLRELTSFTGGRLFEVEKTERLDTIFLGILKEFRQRSSGALHAARRARRKAGTSWTCA